jgi:hypothetical protein
MKTKNILLTVLGLIVAFTFVGEYLSATAARADGTNFSIAVPMTATSTLCGTTPTLLLGTSTSGRNFATISNLSGIAVYLGFGNTATLYKGTAVFASSTLILDSANHTYTGAIYCISTASASTSASDSNI